MGLLDAELLDKVRISAQQAVVQAQLGIAEGQARLDAFQIKRRGDALLRDLGAAYYAEQRTGGGSGEVASALAAVDQHASANGPIDTPAAPSTPATPPTPSTPPARPAGSEHPAATGAPSPPSTADSPVAEPTRAPAEGTTPPSTERYTLDDV